MNTKGFEEIDVGRILSVLWTKKILIAIVSVISAIFVGIVGGLVVTPKYQADILVYVNNNAISLGNFSINAGELTAARKMLDTYLVVIKSRTFLNDVIDKADLPYTDSQLNSMISAGSVNETEIFNVKVTAYDPDEARIIADTIADILPDALSRIIKGSTVEIIDYAVRPTRSISRGSTSYALIGFVGGLVAICGVLAVLEIMNDKVHGEDTLSELCGSIPILAYIPHQGSEKKYAYYSRYSRYGRYGRYGKYGYGKYGKYGYSNEYGHGYGYEHTAKKTETAEKKDNEGKKS